MSESTDNQPKPTPEDVAFAIVEEEKLWLGGHISMLQNRVVTLSAENRALKRLLAVPAATTDVG